MGGMGSGRHWYWGARDTTGDYRSIDVRRWQRDGSLEPGCAFIWHWSRNGKVAASIRVSVETDHVILGYRHRSGGGKWNDECYPVYLNWTHCHLGGQRAWFICPAHDCGRRVALLYGGDIFACRQCFRLAYPSQRETSHDRAARRADRIREKLGWKPGILNGPGSKPKGMHWRTFARLATKHDAFVQASLAGMAPRLSLLGESLDGWY